MDRTPPPPRDRSFGLVWTAVLAALGLWPLVSGHPPRLVLLVAAAVMALLALLAPKVLSPLNLVWHRFGLLLHRIVSPVVLGALFYLVLTPIGAAMRLAGKNLLWRRRPDAPTYWHARPSGRGSMRDQF